MSRGYSRFGRCGDRRSNTSVAGGYVHAVRHPCRKPVPNNVLLVTRVGVCWVLTTSQERQG